jgi:hypothetical protein
MYPAIVGSLLHISTVTRPDIALAAAALARYLSQATKEQLDSVIHVVKYLKSTEKVRLEFGACRNARPVGLYGLPPAPRFRALAYGDADYANCVETRRSVTGIVITVDGTPVGKPQAANHHKVNHCCGVRRCKHDSRRSHFSTQDIADLGEAQKPIPLLCDNTAAECLLKNPI